jgi:hypothetical protein
MKILFSFALTAVSAGRIKRDGEQPAVINNVIDAWNDMVEFPNAETHGCHCLNLNTADLRYRGSPVDELDRVCLDWQNAIKCQRFDGGRCGPVKESELPSYTNYEDCTSNVDACTIALCQINKHFADQVNSLNSNTPILVSNPATNCNRTIAGPKYDSCCFTDVFSSIRYDSASQECVNGAVQETTTTTTTTTTVAPANTPTVPPTDNVDCQDKVIDVVFIIDASSSVDDREYALQQAFTRDLAQNIGLGSSRASVVQ